MNLKARVHVIEHPLTNSAADTEAAMAAYVGAGCDTVVSLGGDGTNRAITRVAPDINLVALSTGTNNVFPQLLELDDRRNGRRTSPRPAACRAPNWRDAKVLRLPFLRRH